MCCLIRRAGPILAFTGYHTLYLCTHIRSYPCIRIALVRMGPSGWMSRRGFHSPSTVEKCYTKKDAAGLQRWDQREIIRILQFVRRVDRNNPCSTGSIANYVRCTVYSVWYTGFYDTVRQFFLHILTLFLRSPVCGICDCSTEHAVRIEWIDYHSLHMAIQYPVWTCQPRGLKDVVQPPIELPISIPEFSASHPPAMCSVRRSIEEGSGGLA